MIFTGKNIGLTREKLRIVEESCKKNKICLYTGCSQSTIRGHSIQKKIITSFPDNGKLMSPSMPNSGIFKSLKGDMGERGSNIASVFHGFCSKHDDSLFKIVEKREYCGEKEQNFVLAFRALAYEFVKRQEECCIMKELIKDVNEKIKESQQKPIEEKDRMFSGFLWEVITDSMEKTSNTLKKKIDFVHDYICKEETWVVSKKRAERIREERKIGGTHEEEIRRKREDRWKEETLEEINRFTGEIVEKEFKPDESRIIEYMNKVGSHGRVDGENKYIYKKEEREREAREGLGIRKIVQSVVKKIFYTIWKNVLEIESSIDRWLIENENTQETSYISFMKEKFGLVEEKIKDADFRENFHIGRMFQIMYYKQYMQSREEDYRKKRRYVKDMQMLCDIFCAVCKDKHKHDFEEIRSDVFEMCSETLFLTSSVIYPEYDFSGERINHWVVDDFFHHPLFCTIFPQNGKTYVIFSYFSRSAFIYSDFLKQIRSNGDKKKRQERISGLVFYYAHNTYISKKKYDELMEREKKEIKEMFHAKEFDGGQKKENLMKPVQVNIFESFKRNE